MSEWRCSGSSWRGAGNSVCAPTILSLAGGASPPGEPGAAISTGTTIAYLGFVLGPATVGGVAVLADLRVALGLVACLAVFLALGAALGRLPQRLMSSAPRMLSV
jgi:MFS family permease